MILHGNPNNWSCLPAAFAMVLDVSPEAFIGHIGHDGSDTPYRRADLKAGFHEQECIEVMQQHGYSCTPVEIGPTISPYLDGYDARKIYFSGGVGSNWLRLRSHMGEADGVLTGLYKATGHAVAWDHRTKTIYDPNFSGQVYELADAPVFGFTPRCFWKVQNVAVHG